MTIGLRSLSSIFLFIATITLSLHSQAGYILSADSVTSPQGDLATYPLSNIIDQSGLSTGYISGVTDFDSFVNSTLSTALGDAGFTATESYGPQVFTFGFSQQVSLDGIAVWNTGSAGAVSSFALYADTDANFYNGTQNQLLQQQSLDTVVGNGWVPAQVFQFGATSTQYIHLIGLDSLTAPDFYGLSEVAFSQSITPVPLPPALGLYLSGLAFAFLAKRNS